MVVIEASKKSKSRTDDLKWREPSRSTTRDRQLSEFVRAESEIRVSRLLTDKEAMQDHDKSRLACNEIAVKNISNFYYSLLRVIGQNEDGADDENKPG